MTINAAFGRARDVRRRIAELNTCAQTEMTFLECSP